MNTQKQLDEFFNNASAVQVEEGTWYYNEANVGAELSKLYQELESMRAENEALIQIAEASFEYKALAKQAQKAWHDLQVIKKNKGSK